MLDVRPEGRDRRLVSAILVLAAIALFFIALAIVAEVTLTAGGANRA